MAAETGESDEEGSDDNDGGLDFEVYSRPDLTTANLVSSSPM